MNDDMFAPIQQIFRDPAFVRRRDARQKRHYELMQFRLRHPILWRLGARPARVRSC